MALDVITIEKDGRIGSREIAEITGKRHSNVVRDIRGMLKELDLDGLKFESVYLAGNGEERIEFRLPEREAMILASSYDVKIRAKLVDYFLATKKPLTALELAKHQVKLLEALEVKEAEVKHLTVTLDKAEEWSTIKKQEAIHKESFKYVELRRYSNEKGIEIKKAFDQNYGTVNSYHADTWLAVYGVEL